MRGAHSEPISARSRRMHVTLRPPRPPQMGKSRLSRKLSQAEALWESKSQIAGLAYQDIRYKGLVYQTARQNNNNQSTRNFITTRGHPLVQHAGVLGLLMSLELPHGLSGELEAFQSWGTSSRRAHPRFRKHHHFSMRLLHRHGTDR